MIPTTGNARPTDRLRPAGRFPPAAAFSGFTATMLPLRATVAARCRDEIVEPDPEHAGHERGEQRRSDYLQHASWQLSSSEPLLSCNDATRQMFPRWLRGVSALINECGHVETPKPNPISSLPDALLRADVGSCAPGSAAASARSSTRRPAFGGCRRAASGRSSFTSGDGFLDSGGMQPAMRTKSTPAIIPRRFTRKRNMRGRGRATAATSTSTTR